MGSKDYPMYIATTDWPYPQRFDIDTLDTLELLRPENGFGMTGCTHWHREPDTDNSIIFAFKVSKRPYSQVPIKRVGPNKRVGWIFIKYFCLSLCLFLSSCFFGAK